MPPSKKFKEKRKFDRFETDVKIDFYVSFDVRTKIDFRVKDSQEGTISPQKYSAISKNLSAEGMSFVSDQKLEKGDGLLLDVFIPSANRPIRMEGAVRWCQEMPPGKNKALSFETGIKLVTVNGSSVEKSISVDPIHRVVWSIVLESVFGSFKHLALKDRKRFSSLITKL
jgi:hypothetical protein